MYALEDSLGIYSDICERPIQLFNHTISIVIHVTFLTDWGIKIVSCDLVWTNKPERASINDQSDPNFILTLYSRKTVRLLYMQKSNAGEERVCFVPKTINYLPPFNVPESVYLRMAENLQKSIWFTIKIFAIRANRTQSKANLIPSIVYHYYWKRFMQFSDNNWNQCFLLILLESCWYKPKTTIAITTTRRD